MKRILSLAKYQLRDNRSAVLIFYAVLIAIVLILNLGDGEGTRISGASMIFIFVAGLNCFRPSFLFAQANNISRRSFYLATILALMGLAVILGVADTLFDSLMDGYPFYHGFFEQFYPASVIAKLLWTITLLMFSASVGWMITMFYYRANVLVKVLISMSPLVFIILASYIDQRTDGRFGNLLLNFLLTSMGFSGETPNPYPAVLSFTLATLLVWGVNYLLVRRAPVRPY